MIVMPFAWLLRCLAVFCAAAITVAPPPSPDNLWRNFNAMLVISAERALVNFWTAADQRGVIFYPDIDRRFAGAMQAAVSAAYSHFDLAIAVAVWEAELPAIYWEHFLHRTALWQGDLRLSLLLVDPNVSSTCDSKCNAVGITPYSRCLGPPISARVSYAPCGEGSAIGEISRNDIQKAFMIFYSPNDYDRGPPLPVTHRVFFQHSIGAAIEVCLRRLWHTVFDLREFGDCIVSVFGEPSGYTGIRGMAVIPTPPPEIPDFSALPYGIAGPSGQVVVAPIKMIRSDTQQAFFSGFPADLKEICLIFGVPLVRNRI